MTEPNLDELAELAYAAHDPQFQRLSGEDVEYLKIDALIEIEEAIDTARKTIIDYRENFGSRRLNEVDRLLSEAEDKVGEMLERGI